MLVRENCSENSMNIFYLIFNFHFKGDCDEGDPCTTDGCDEETWTCVSDFKCSGSLPHCSAATGGVCRECLVDGVC